MFCVNCGAQIPDDSAFCGECGTKLEASAPAKGLSQKAKIGMIAFAAAFALCIVGIVLSVVIKPTINLNKYLTAEYAGFDGYGTANVQIDMARFAEDYGKKLAGNNKKQDEIGVASAFLSNINGELDKQNALKNGDVIQYTWACDDTHILEKYGYKLKYQDAEFTVEGLEEAKTFDPFEGKSVEFSGIAPNGQASIVGEATHEAARNLWYKLDKDSDLSNGMTVTMSFECYYNDVEEYFITNYGVLPATTEKTFTVEKLDKYVTALDEISETSLESMKKKAEEKFKETLPGEDAELKALTYCGKYLIANETDADSWNNNKVYLVYQAKVQNDYTNETDETDETSEAETFSQLTTYYWYITFDGLLVDAQGEVTVDVDDYDVANNRFEVDSGISAGWHTKRWTYYGYETLDALYESAIAKNVGEKTCTNDIVVPKAG